MTIPRGSAGRRVAEERLAERRLAAKRPDGAPLVWVVLATAVGGVASSILPPIGWSWIAVAIAATLLAWLIAWRAGSIGMACGWLLTAIVLLAFGWTYASWHLFPADDLGRFASRDAGPICFEAVTTSAAVIYPAEEHAPFQAIPPADRTVVEVRATSLRDATAWRAASGRCELTIAGRLEGLRPGDRVQVFGQLRKPEPARNPGQRDAAVRDRAQRQLALVWTEAPACVTRLETQADGTLRQAATTLRDGASQAVNQQIDADALPLVRAMVLGDISGLSEETIEAFRHTGTLHVLVVSGLHVGLVAAILPGLAALGLIPRRYAWLGALLLVAVYVVIAGGRPPAVRAGVVASAACLAALAGRQPLSANSLAGAAVAVFAISPGAWINAGTQLSFLAAATLLGVAAWAARRRARFTPPLERLIESARSPLERFRRRGVAWIGWVMAATLAVQVVTGPLVAAEFHLVSPAATPLALVISPLIALTVSSGVGLLVAESVGLTGVAWLAGQFSGGSATLLGGAIQHAAEAPGASFWVPGPTMWWSVVWACGLIGSAGVRVFQPRITAVAWRGLLAWLAVGFAPTVWQSLTPADDLRCSFIAVGHGSATLLESPQGETVLIDAGALGSPDRVTDLIARTLWSRGITRLDAVLLTHPDIDHYNGLPGLLDRFAIDAVWSTTRMFPAADDPADKSGPAELRRVLVEAGVPIRELVQGDRLRLGQARLEVLHPDELGVIGSDNANSLVLGVEYEGRRLLLPGDLESPGTELLLAQEPYDCDVLLAPHHGSRLSNPPGFAAWCEPEMVVISSGQSRNKSAVAYQHSGACVISTYDQGMVSLRISSHAVNLAPLERGNRD